MAYFGRVTGEDNEMGMNGALMQRKGPAPEPKILEHGGKVAVAKHAFTGMAWQGYYFDTDRHLMAIHQPDENAK